MNSMKSSKVWDIVDAAANHDDEAKENLYQHYTIM